jgi:hypothetical protein
VCSQRTIPGQDDSLRQDLSVPPVASAAPAAPAAAARKQRGAWGTPPALIEFLIDHVLDPAVASRRNLEGFRVLDPACGDGRILDAAVRRLAPRFGEGAARRAIHGIELDPATARAARRALRIGPDQLPCADARTLESHVAGGFDVVLGNPPYLNQLASATTRAGSSPLGGGPYADAAAEFLALALRAARPDTGRVGLVLPMSLLATRDAAPIRGQALHSAALTHIWWVGQQVFDAAVRTIVVGFRRGTTAAPVRRWTGVPPTAAPAADPPQPDAATWGPLVADLVGVPRVELPPSSGRLGDWATALAGFRQHFYGLAPFVSDDGDGPPLVTTGLIDPGHSAWARRPARFAGTSYAAPRVDLAALRRTDRRLAAWVQARHVPKVVVASQTRVIEAAVDPAGDWVPSVPVVALVPHRPDDLWRLGAVLCAPPLSACAAAHCLGAALTPGAIKLRPAELLDLPLPAHSLAAAVDRLQAGDVDGCAVETMAAYGIDDPALLSWWRAGASLQAPRGSWW